MKEAASQNHILLEAARLGCDLYRNNSGVLNNDKGVPVRYGLANESAAINKRFKSSDLIGITPIRITPEMVGSIVGVFTAIECKHTGWKFNPQSEHETAQLAFINLILRDGGYAGFASTPEEFRRIIRAS